VITLLATLGMRQRRASFQTHAQHSTNGVTERGKDNPGFATIVRFRVILARAGPFSNGTTTVAPALPCRRCNGTREFGNRLRLGHSSISWLHLQGSTSFFGLDAAHFPTHVITSWMLGAFKGRSTVRVFNQGLSCDCTSVLAAGGWCSLRRGRRFKRLCR